MPVLVKTAWEPTTSFPALYIAAAARVRRGICIGKNVLKECMKSCRQADKLYLCMHVLMNLELMRSSK